MAAAGTQRERGTRYRKRRPLPALAALVVLAVAAVVVWVTVGTSSSKTDASITCSVPPGRSVGTVLDGTALDQVKPSPVADVKVRVLNAGGKRGQAGLLAATLKQLHFQTAGDGTNDPLYQKTPMDCRGQLRFGKAGESAARTLSILEPCSQLVRDNRQDASVDFAIGQKFDDLRPSDNALKVLKAIDGQGADGGPSNAELQQARTSATCR